MTGPDDAPMFQGEPIVSERLMERSLLIAGILYVVLLFDVWYGGLVERLDGPLMSLLALLPDTLRAVTGMLFSIPGESWLLAGVVVVAVVRVWSRGSVRSAVLLGGSALALGVFIQFSKWVIGRPRPETFTAGTSWMPEWFYSTSMAFPSGHSAAPVLVYGLALVAFWGPKPRPSALLPLPSRISRRVLVAVLALAFLPGVGRLIWGLHWTTDVVAGWLLGTAWLTATLLLAGQWSSQPQPLAGTPVAKDPGGPIE